MFELFIHLFIVSYLVAFHATYAAQQNITSYSSLSCYFGSSQDTFLNENSNLLEKAVCDLPAISHRNSIRYNYTLGDYSSAPFRTLEIVFNETITRNYTEQPLKNFIVGDGIVTSEAFNGYRARELVMNPISWSPNTKSQCDANGGYTQSILGILNIAVFPDSLSEEKKNAIVSNWTLVNDTHTIYGVRPAMSPYELFHAFINNTGGLVCYGSVTTEYSTHNL